jgi:hypothetical protein
MTGINLSKYLPGFFIKSCHSCLCGSLGKCCLDRHCERSAAIQRFILKGNSGLPRFARNDSLGNESAFIFNN